MINRFDLDDIIDYIYACNHFETVGRVFDKDCIYGPIYTCLYGIGLNIYAHIIGFQDIYSNIKFIYHKLF